MLEKHMDVEVLLTRAENSLDKFLGKSVKEVLKVLDEDAMRPSNLIELITGSIQVHTMLQEKETRDILIMAMKKTEAEEFAKFIGIKEWENIHYKLAHIKFTKTVMKKALEFFGREFDEKSANVKTDSEIVGPKRILFQHQIDTVEKIRKKLGKSPHKALLHMPTGSGKTISAMRVILIHLLENPSTSVIWLAYNEELCEQAMNEFQRMWCAAGDRKIKTYRFFGKSKVNLLKVKDGFIVASLLKMLGAAGKNNTFLSEMAQKTGLVVIDEAHQATAKKFSIIIEELAENKDTKLLGLSATPGRKSDSTNIENIALARFFAQQKVMLDTGSENPITFLTEKGYLAKPKFNKIEYNGNTLSDTDIKKLEKDIDVPKYILEKLSEDAKRNLKITVEIMRLAKTHNKIIVFASAVEHARSISLILSAKKYNSHYINSKTPSGIRSDILYRYKETKDPMILCNYGILTTGFDAPQTSAIVIARPTKSYVLYAQMVGRGIRGIKAGGNKTCEISTVIDSNINDFIDITEVFTRWEDLWNDA